VPIEDVFGQLAKGKVEVPVNKLLAGVPKEYIVSGATLDSEVLVALPLSVVVEAIPPDELKKRTAEQPAKSTARDLPDLFDRADKKEAPKPVEASKPVAPAIPVSEAVRKAAISPDELKERTAEQPAKSTAHDVPHLFERAGKKETPKPVVASKPPAPAIPLPEVAREAAPKVEPEAPSVPATIPVPKVESAISFAGLPPKMIMTMDLIAGGSMTSPPAEEPVAPKVEKQKLFVPVAPAQAQVSVSGEPVLLLRGLDLNQVSAEELMRVVDGIGESMAQRIVEDRTQNGPFFGLYDLGRVPGIGSKIYEKITGQPWLDEKYGQLRLVNEILGRWTGRHPDFGDVAAKFKAIPGFEGCVILHRDGHLLAASWQIESPERLQAMAPQMMKKVKHYMRHIMQGELCSVTVLLEGFSFTFVESEDICFVAVHNPKGFSRRHMQIVNGLGMALGRRFSGYRGA
jgi:competence ComEA-like helix-hairpin-helix protein